MDVMIENKDEYRIQKFWVILTHIQYRKAYTKQEFRDMEVTDNSELLQMTESVEQLPIWWLGHCKNDRLVTLFDNYNQQQ